MSGLKKESLDELVKLNLELSKEVDFTKKINMISNTIRDIIKADRCTLFVHDKKAKTFWTSYVDGVSYIEIPDDKGIVSQVYNTRKTIIENNVEKNSSFYNNIDNSSGYITKSIIAVPIFGFSNECIGVIQLLNKAYGEEFNKEDEDVIFFVAKHFCAYIQMIIQEN